MSDLTTTLTYEEALAIHAALEHAYRAERARIDALVIPHEQALTRSVLFDRLSTAKRIMDVRRERAEEMGG